jgi:hypothetical protein
LRGKGTKLGERGKGSELSEPCPKVRLSQDRLTIEIFAHISISLSQAYFAQMLFDQMSLRANVTQPFTPGKHFQPSSMYEGKARCLP